MRSFYYNIDDAEFVDAAGEKVPRLVPELFYQEHAVWRLFLRDRENRVRDLSGVTAWSAAVDCDHSAATTPMCRTLAEEIAVDLTTGAVSVGIDAATAEFLAAVNGSPRRRAYFELCGYNSAGERELCLEFEIFARMIIDPDPAVSPETPETIATKTYVAAVIGSAADSAYSAACAGVSGAIASGGYVTSSGARVIAADAASSAVSGAIVSGAEFVTSVGGYTVALTSGGGLVVSGSGGESLVLSDGTVSLRVSENAIDMDEYSTSIHGGTEVGIAAGQVVCNGRPVLTELATSTDTTTTSASFAELAGGTAYIYTQPLTALNFGSITSDCRALFKFTAGSGFNLGLPSGAELVGLSAYDIGTRYVVAIGDGMVIVNPVTVVGA